MPAWLWPALASLAAAAPFASGLSLANVFYIRDLTMFFWPRHLWIRSSLLAGHWPLWDVYAAAGQATFPDALNQLFLPPVLALRVLLPAVLGFNLVVAAPFPLAALGSWFFLRRYFSATSAMLGGVVFAVSGPVVSTGNFPNLSWSVAWIPWLLWAVDRDRATPSIRNFSLVVAIAALQVFSGEPVTMMGTWVLVFAYVAGCTDMPGSNSARARVLGRVIAAIAVAGIVSVVQLVPMALAARVSPRGLMRADNFWSVHPLWLVESVLPHIFGDTFRNYNAQLPWIRPLNSNRDPFFYSLYVGPVVMVLCFLGAVTGRRRWRLFWLAVVVCAVVFSFGDYTPVYPALQRVVTVVRSFRFPAKFLVFASLGLAMLVANAAHALQARAESRESSAPSRLAVRATIGAGLVAALALVALISLVLVAPFTGARAFYNLGLKVGVADAVLGAEYLFRSVPPIATRILILLLTSALLAYLGWAARHEGWVARALLFSVAIVDLVVVNAGLNPVLPASRIGPPAWAAALKAHPAERFYFGGKFRGTIIQSDFDLRQVRWSPPRAGTVEEGRTIMAGNLAMTPAAWSVRELISYDLPQLWPVQHARAVTFFEGADRAARMRFLGRSGVRYCLLDSPPRPDAQPIQAVGEDFQPMAVYECVPDARRAYVVPNASVVPDLDMQLALMFRSEFDAETTVMLERPAPAAAESSGAPVPASARITHDGDEEITIDASAEMGGGYLVLADSYDRAWRVDVDGVSAPLLRANALYRAVRLAPGRHTVRFVYRPTVFYACLALSGFVAVALAALASWNPRWSEGLAIAPAPAGQRIA
jgi:hypothetical protein